MIQNIDACYRLFAILLLGSILSGCATDQSRSIYVGKIGNYPLTFSCDSQGMVDTPCQLAMDSSVDKTLRFSNQRTRYAHLLRQGVEEVLRDPRNPDRPRESDIPLIHSLALDECHPAEKSKFWSGDLLQLCIPRDSSAVVLFFRGVCDRCTFEPAVLRRKQEQ